MSDRVELWLRGFSEHWQRRVRDGKSSDFDRLEWIAIEIFADWLSQDMATKADGGGG